jgi:membrane fusion protein (multidrug efflux system)
MSLKEFLAWILLLRALALKVPRIPWSSIADQTCRNSLMTPFRSHNRAYVVAGVIAALALILAWWGSQRGTGEDYAHGGGRLAAAEDAVPVGVAIPVEADTVRRGTLVLKVTGTGQTEANRRATIAAPTSGPIAAVGVRESDFVGRGGLLVRLDAREAAFAIARAEAALEEAHVRYREFTLFDERITDPAVREERAEAARAKSGLAQAEVALREARLALGRTTVTAPFAGSVANVRSTLGEHVTQGQELLTLVDLDPIKVEVQVVEGELQWLREGGGADIHLSAFPDMVFHGRIATINPVVDPDTRTARVTVVVPNPSGTILPGMFARVVLDGREFHNHTLVPTEAILERDGRTLVFLFEPLPDGPGGEGLAKWVYVTPGLANDRFVELVENERTEVPEPGRLVLTGGNVTLIHDARVRITGE